MWDAPSQSAFGQVLGLANNSGTTWHTALANYQNGTPMQWDAKTGTYVRGTPGTARTKAPVVTNFTSPDDLAITAQGVATAKLGRSFSPQELQKFIAAYHGTEQSATAASAAGQSFTAPATAANAATTFAEQADPTAYNAEQFLPLVQNHMTHPRYFGLFNPAPVAPAQWADRIAGAFNPQLASSGSSPTPVEIEAHVIRAVARRAGFSSKCRGTLHYQWL